MAIFHLHCKIVSRVGGRSVVAASAYRAATVLRDHRLGQTFDFSRKNGVELSAILAPEGAPSWGRDRATLWNKVEAAERRCDSALAREITLALPVELSRAAQEKLLVAYVTEQFVARGMVADCNLHRDNPDNPHAHILLTTRLLTATGFGPKERSWNDRTLVSQWRHAWEVTANHALAREGYEVRIDARSFETQGIPLEPTRKVGVVPGDVRVEREEANEAIRRENGRIIERSPVVALRALTHDQATFTRHQLNTFLQQKTADEVQRQACEKAILSSPSLVILPAARGLVPRLTSREMLETEGQMLAAAGSLSETKAWRPITHAQLASISGVQNLSNDQQRALANLVADTGNLALLEGYAGTGKGVTLAAARAAWESRGQRVLGAALSAKAADGLGQSTGMPARTIAAWEYAWSRGKHELRKGDVFVLDEASMVGTRQLERVLTYANAQGAKVVLAGDARQLQAIEAGAPFRALAERLGHVTLATVRRQREAWQQEATVHFAKGNVLGAVQAYADHGCLHGHATREQTAQALVGAWRRHQQQWPEKSAVLLAYRRDEVAQLNVLAREAQHSEAARARGCTIQTERGARDMVLGERLMFLRNDAGLGVRNGTLGTVEKVTEKEMQVRLEPSHGQPAQRVAFALRDYRDLDYGYATTLHKAQGLTVEKSFVWAGRNLDQQASYVAFTRHRDGIQVHYALEDFPKGEKALTRSLTRAHGKDLAMDHVPAPESPGRHQERHAPGSERDREHSSVRADFENLSVWARKQAVRQAEYATLEANQLAIKLSEAAQRGPRSARDILHESPDVVGARNRWESAERALMGVHSRIKDDRRDRPIRSTLQLGRVSYQEGTQVLQLSYKQAIERAETERSQAKIVYQKALEMPGRKVHARVLATQEVKQVRETRDSQQKVKNQLLRLVYRSRQMQQVEIELAPTRREFEREICNPQHNTDRQPELDPTRGKSF